jgi:hypothetical protein
LLSAGLKFNLIRVLGEVDFETPYGWSAKYQAIIDTGSPANLVPQPIWTQVNHRVILPKKVFLGGIGEGEVAGYVGEVTARVSHRKKFSRAIKLKAFLLESDETPLVFGFEDFLSVGTFHSCYPKNMASMKL